MESSTSTRTPGASPSSTGPAQSRSRATPGAALGPLKRFLTLREGSIVVVTVAVFVYFAVSTPNFVSGSNFKNLLPFFAPLAIMAAGEVFVMTLGEIDLSIGAVYLWTPFLFWKLTVWGLPLIPAVVIALLVASAIGGVNGVLTAYIGIPSFVATLGMLFVLDGLTLVVSHSEQINTP